MKIMRGESVETHQTDEEIKYESNRPNSSKSHDAGIRIKIENLETSKSTLEPVLKELQDSSFKMKSAADDYTFKHDDYWNHLKIGGNPGNGATAPKN